MASIIQLKSGTGSAVPSALAQGEVGINVDNGLFYYGSGSVSSVKQLENFTSITASSGVSASGDLIGNKIFIGTPGSSVGSFSGSGNKLTGFEQSDGSRKVWQFSGTTTGGTISVYNTNSEQIKLSPNTGIFFDSNLVGVSIGTTTSAEPDCLLLAGAGHITASGTISASGDIIADAGTGSFGHVSASGHLIGASLKLADADSFLYADSNEVSIYETDSNSNLGVKLSTSATKGTFAVYSAGSTKISLDGYNDAYFNHNGGVIIGGTTTDHKFEVVGTSKFSSTITASGAISGSTLITAASASLDVLTGTGGTSGLEVTGFVSASSQVLAATGSFDTLTRATVIETFGYFVNASHTAELWVPLGGTTSEYTYDNYLNKFACPYNGKVKRVSLQWQTNDPGNGVRVRVRKDTANSGAQDGDIGDADSIFEDQLKDSVVDDTVYHFDFSSSFARGDTIGITVTTPNIAASNEFIYGTLVMEFDTST
jgi:hypothetical protein